MTTTRPVGSFSVSSAQKQKRTRASELPSHKSRFTDATYKVKKADGTIETLKDRNALEGWKKNNQNEIGYSIHRSIKADERLSSDQLTELTLERLYTDSKQGVIGGKQDEKLVKIMFPEANNVWGKLHDWITGNPRTDNEVVNKLKNHYSQKQALFQEGQERQKVEREEIKYRQDLNQTLVDGICKNPSNRSFSDTFYNTGGATRHLENLEVTLPAIDEQRKQVVDHATKAQELQTEINALQNQLKISPTKSDNVAQVQHEVAKTSLEEKQKALENHYSEIRKLLTKDGANENLANNYFGLSDTVVENLKTQKEKTLKNLKEANANAPVPIVYNTKKEKSEGFAGFFEGVKSWANWFWNGERSSTDTGTGATKWAWARRAATVPVVGGLILGIINFFTGNNQQQVMQTGMPTGMPAGAGLTLAGAGR